MSTKTIELNSKQSEMVYLSLLVRICFIETGTASMRANDAIKCGKANSIKELSSEQRKLIVEMEELMSKLI